MLNKIIKRIGEVGGIPFLVGGAVRDEFLGLENKDIDIEIFNLTSEKLKSVLAEFGVVDEVGANFGVFMIHGLLIDFSLPRKEIKAKVINKDNLIKIPCYYDENIMDCLLQLFEGYKIVIDKFAEYGHKDFVIITNPFIDTKEASKRRDFTINNLMKNMLTGELIDNWGGINDINGRIISHIDDRAFIEDPLRVLRACQFSARFGFDIALETIELCKKIDLKSLPKERIYEELKKGLMKSGSPSLMFYNMNKVGALRQLLPEIHQLIECEQSPMHHPEGNAFIHTMLALDEASKLKNFSTSAEIFMFATLFHDVGKIETTVRDIEGNIKSIGHEDIGVAISEKAVKNFTLEKRLIEGIKPYIQNHMKILSFYSQEAGNKAIRKLVSAVNIEDLLLISRADFNGRATFESFDKIEFWWRTKLEELEIKPNEGIVPLVMGKDLVKSGLKPGKEFKNLLENAFELQLEGFNKETILYNLFK